MQDLLLVAQNAFIIFIFIIAYTRLFGLRSFSKMTNFDFAVTIAIGSVVASGILNTDRSVLYSLIALLSLYGLKTLTAWIQVRWTAFDSWTANQPVLLMRNGKIDEEEMKRQKVNKDELIAKLREANVLKMSAVRAVVLETTGDVSVLHGEELEEDLLFGVKDVKST
ncbi:MAG: YetF domain-containing protein [Bacteroidota bacterium]